MGTKKTVEEMVEGLAIAVQRGFEALEKKIDNKIDSKVDALAIAVQHGFQGVAEEFKGVKEEFESVRSEFKEGFESVRSEFKEGLSGVENELISVKFQASSLDPRVSTLEKKVNIIGMKLGLQS